MSTKLENIQPDVVLDAHGNIDLDFYRKQGEQLRAEELAKLTRQLKHNIGSYLTKLCESLNCTLLKPSH